MEGVEVVADAVPGRGVLFLQLVEELFAAVQMAIGRFGGGIDGDFGAFFIINGGETFRGIRAVRPWKRFFWFKTQNGRVGVVHFPV